MTTANRMRSKRRSRLMRRLTLGVLLGACFVSVRQTQAQDSAVDYVNQGLTWDKKGEYDRAIAQYDQAIWLDPHDARPYYNRGTAWQNKGEYNKAIADYNQALKLDPSAAAYTNRGFAWSNKKPYDRAIADYDQAIKLDLNAAAYNSLAWLQVF